jgi:hypothetical protein
MAVLSPENKAAVGGAEEGGIRVAVRLRPAKAGEVTGSPPPVAIDHERRTVAVTQKDSYGSPQVQAHEFDQVYDHDCRQEDMYNELGVPLVRSSITWQ